jgi:hypothetical protein
MTTSQLFPFAVFASQSRQDFRWRWEPRTDPLNWKLAESCDLDSIVRNGDLSSLEFFAQSFVHSNISREDAAHFGSKAALTLFQIMQLAVDYLLQQTHNYSLIAIQQSEYARATTAAFAQLQQKITEQDIQIQRLNSAVQQLKAQNQAMEKQLRKAKRRGREKVAKEVGWVEFTPEPGFLNVESEFAPINIGRVTRNSVAEMLDVGERREWSQGEVDPENLQAHLSGSEEGSGELWPERRG